MSASEEEDFMYDSEDEEASDDFGDTYGFQDSDDVEESPTSHAAQASYVVLDEKDILERQREAVDMVCSVLSLPGEGAGLLLRHFKWSVSKVNDEWFADEVKTRRAVGLLLPPDPSPSGPSEELTCGVCFEDFPRAKLRSSPRCNHYYCDECWVGYMHTAVGDGPGCLALRCPDDRCPAVVGDAMCLELLSPEDCEKYNKFLLRSYIEDNRKAKWCPAPSCEFAVEMSLGASSFDVKCKCGHQFCWNCSEEAHRPVSCETVRNWILKNSSEAENVTWILANSKPCPKCKRPIEKNQGCMHMSCTPPCRHEFCWLCLGNWSDHGERTGGFYACNRYETQKQEGVYDETERRRDMAKNSLERYTHYYERWASNEQSRMKALDDLRIVATEKVEELSELQKQPVSQLKFVNEAWEQIVECRRVLKWTYAFGFYLPEYESAKREMFEYYQGYAEAALERLHQCAEKELGQFVNADEADKNLSKFDEFRTRLAGLTSVTRTYFDNLVKGLENNLEEVTSFKDKAVEAGPSKQAKTTNTSKGKSSGRGPGRGARGGDSSGGASAGEANLFWSCERCTYVNKLSSQRCEMCDNERHQGGR